MLPIDSVLTLYFSEKREKPKRKQVMNKPR